MEMQNPQQQYAYGITWVLSILFLSGVSILFKIGFRFNLHKEGIYLVN